MNLASSFVQDTQKYAIPRSCRSAKGNLLNEERDSPERERIIINVVYVASFVSPGGIQLGTLVYMGNISARDRLVGYSARDTEYIRTREYIMRAVRTLRSIIIQADEPAINERLLSLINVTYVITRTYVSAYACGRAR